MCSLRVSYCPVLTLPVRRNEATRMRQRDVRDTGSVTRRQGAPDLPTLRPEHLRLPCGMSKLPASPLLYFAAITKGK